MSYCAPRRMPTPCVGALPMDCDLRIFEAEAMDLPSTFAMRPRAQSRGLLIRIVNVLCADGAVAKKFQPNRGRLSHARYGAAALHADAPEGWLMEGPAVEGQHPDHVPWSVVGVKGIWSVAACVFPATLRIRRLASQSEWSATPPECSCAVRRVQLESLDSASTITGRSSRRRW